MLWEINIIFFLVFHTYCPCTFACLTSIWEVETYTMFYKVILLSTLPAEQPTIPRLKQSTNVAWNHYWASGPCSPFSGRPSKSQGPENVAPLLSFYLQKDHKIHSMVRGEKVLIRTKKFVQKAKKCEDFPRNCFKIPLIFKFIFWKIGY